MSNQETAADQNIPVLSVLNNQAVTTSLEVSRIFEKRHDNVSKDIKELLGKIPEGYGLLNFEEASYSRLQERLEFAIDIIGDIGAEPLCINDSKGGSQ